MYFAQLPRLNYRLSYNPYKEPVKSVFAVDITAGARIVRGAVRDIQIVDSYSVRDFETPEIVAEVLWGVAEWHWVLLVLNEIFHPSGWVLSSRDFEGMIETKYGSKENADRVAFYRDQITHEVVLPELAQVKTAMDYTSEIGFPFIRWFDSNNAEIQEPDFADTIAGYDAVTYYEYESELNENKREIKIVSKAVADVIVSQYKAQMAGGAV